MKKLKEICMKRDNNPRTKVKLNRFFGLITTKLLTYTPFTGNQVSFFMMFLAFVVFGLFSVGKFWYTITGLILLHLQLILDSADGMISRYRNTCSIRGVFLDILVHSVSEPLVFFGLTLGIFRNTNSFMILIFGFLAALFSLLYVDVKNQKNQVIMMKLMQYATGKNLNELEGKKFEVINTNEGKSGGFIFWKKIVKKSIYYVSEWTAYILIFAILFNFVDWFLIFYGIVLPLEWLIIMVYEFKIGYKPLEFLFEPYKPR